MFEWHEPQGSGPQVIVDNYIIIISPRPLYPADVNIVPNLPEVFYATLNYNTLYTATIIAENCAGESPTLVYPFVIEYGKSIILETVFALIHRRNGLNTLVGENTASIMLCSE